MANEEMPISALLIIAALVTIGALNTGMLTVGGCSFFQQKWLMRRCLLQITTFPSKYNGFIIETNTDILREM